MAVDVDRMIMAVITVHMLVCFRRCVGFFVQPTLDVYCFCFGIVGHGIKKLVWGYFAIDSSSDPGTRVKII